MTSEDLTFYRGSNSFALKTLDIRNSKLSGEIWVFGVRLEVSPTEWPTVETDCWSEQNFSRSSFDFGGKVFANLE